MVHAETHFAKPLPPAPSPGADPLLPSQEGASSFPYPQRQRGPDLPPDRNEETCPQHHAPRSLARSSPPFSD